jgi:hypothetical protein
MATSRPRVLLVFVDGLGIGVDDGTANPVHSGVCPHIALLLRDHSVAIDALLGVPGLPQSATGQTTLLTGVSAQARLGCHVVGFPGKELREIITEHNIFRVLCGLGLRVTFANAYFVRNPADAAAMQMKSVTTVATLSALGAVRGLDAMLRNEAVYQDLTRDALRSRGYKGPAVTAPAAAAHLAAIAGKHDFTLFEYFQTDRAGHSGDAAWAKSVLGLLDGFLQTLMARTSETGITLVLTSDHGNIEDISSPTHTANPVPFAAVGPGAGFLLGRVRSIADVTPALIELLKQEQEDE